MPDTTFASRLRAVRQSAGLSIYALAKKSGMGAGHLSQLESGRRSPTWETVQRLADALGVSVEKFRASD